MRMNQRKRHRVVTDREGRYKWSRRIAFDLGYKHKPRWRQTTLKKHRVLQQFQYAAFGPYTVGARKKERN